MIPCPPGRGRGQFQTPLTELASFAQFSPAERDPYPGVYTHPRKGVIFLSTLASPARKARDETRQRARWKAREGTSTLDLEGCSRSGWLACRGWAEAVCAYGRRIIGRRTRGIGARPC